MQNKSKIDELNESLYSRHYKAPNDHRDPLDIPESKDVEKNWESPKLDDLLAHERRQTPNFPIMKRLFTFALVFCVAAAAVAGYIYIGGGNLISSKNVDISVEGPVSVTAGAPLELAVTVSNKNNADLTLVNMIIMYPEGTRSAEDSNEALVRVKEALGAIPAGKSVTRTERALLFGEKGEIKNIKISLDYKVKGSNATFSKEKIYEISLGSAPVTMSVEQPQNVASGDQFTTTITLTANSTEVLKKMVVRAEYPYGFFVSSSDPKATANENVWNIGDLSPGDKKVIILKGSITGEDAEERTFRFYVGSGKGDEPNEFDTLASVSETLEIKKSALSLSLRLNGEESVSVAPSGRSVQGSIVYKNNSPTNVRNARVEVKFSGSVLDRFSITPQGGGFYNSSANSIVWDQSDVPGLATLAPGDSGTLSFTFSSLPSTTSSKNSEINLDATFSGTPSSGSADLIARNSSKLKIASEVSFSGRTLYSRGPFKNIGPIPPKAEKETTYTVVLNLGNTSNDVTGTKVTATLGPNVTWLGEISPATEKIAYNENNNTVTWSPDTLVSGAGFSAPGKEVSMRLSISPSIGQIGSAPVLLQNINFKGDDVFTGQSLSLNLAALTTRINTDPAYVQGDELVVK